ncbi:hypothetical protein SAMN02745883_01156 [Caminicella sporogenes DSM 14501]|uniref:SLH domain-containing protein n=1 Tax=Caminicella sporogenes DSM 14501 TaxID=1121266 RepID=A0A1M6PDB0_9FIRM|nr:S-layer homology domain-containing protein [Caminicella sporogenes]RKD21442.1 hypothetical protein BET04_08365 [Caminicella sporogenes]SHK05933.1 hypothetical protein SAMN02745883_01156 [Caminicella sporogenes DSM 14501]
MSKRKSIISVILCLSIFFTIFSISFADIEYIKVSRDRSIDKAIEYLHKVQNDDGGFPSKKGKKSSVAVTCWTIMALSAAGEKITDSSWRSKGKSPIDYIKESKINLEETIDYARMLLTLSSVNEDYTYNGENLLNKIISFQQEDGEFCQIKKGEKGMINAHMWSILAIASTGHNVPNSEKAKKWLVSRQNEDGGFGWAEGIQSDLDDTAIAIQTLIILGENPKTSYVVKKALEYMKNQMQKDGGFSAGEWMGKDSNSASDSWGIQALIAAGEDLFAKKWLQNGENPITHLIKLQSKEGFFYWKKRVNSSPVQMTAYAIIALCQKPFPVNLDYKSYKLKDRVFSDLKNDYWAYDEIMKLVRENVLSGYPDNTFKPENLVTRAEFTKYVVAGLGLKDMMYSDNLKFDDISKNHWAYDFICIGVNKGFIKGRSESKFDPNGKITGAEIATMLVRCLPKEKIINLKRGPYWYSGYVEIAKKRNILYPNFNPEKAATRAQCAYSVMKLQNILQD